MSVEEWAKIRRLHRSEGRSISEIARMLGVSRNTVRAALSSADPPKYRRRPMGSVADAAEPKIRELLTADPRMPATVIAERIGWSHSIRTLRGRVRELRPLYLPPDPASTTAYSPGAIAQCAFWFPNVVVPVGFGQIRTAAALPVLTMISGYSWWVSAALLPTRSAEDLYVGWWQQLSMLGATPRAFVWDGEDAVGRWRTQQPELTAACHTFCSALDATVQICRPGDPEGRRLVNQFRGCLERAFLPGRRFSSPADFNTQLREWLTQVNHHRHRALGFRPADRIEADKAAMLALPRVRPALGWQASSTRLQRDQLVRIDGNNYSVHPDAVGRPIEVTADLDRVQVWCQGILVADHARVWAKHQTIRDPAHNHR
ncbi:Transposase [Mycobacterium canettii CIPT 140070010]|nr:Transposase [Mycobacterium canettii CIPT 140070010]